ncbi:hypothetical protein ACJ72_04428 [Emergomyces africanus]|uniref:Uncharacterized protein n=1 Tax=Emergomyces africanus TaxID=1955775 RepID=A0A1B7NWU0_9EURO|nr:hypothetical protein ACJ72_04428 [Emergomyces africanus]
MSVDLEPAVDRWRALALSYQRLLKDNGLSSQQIREIRHSIDSQKYWQPEVQIFKQRVALHEHKMQEALRKKDKAQRQHKLQGRGLAERTRRA